MKNYSYAEGFTVPDRNKPHTSGSHQETTVLGSEEPTQVFTCPTEEPTEDPTEEPTEEPTHETIMSGSEDPNMAFPFPPEEPNEDEEPTEEPIPVAHTASPTKRCHTKSEADNSTFDTPPRKKKLVENEMTTSTSTAQTNRRFSFGNWLTKTVTPSPRVKPRHHSKRDTQTSMSMYVVPLDTTLKKCESLKSTDKFKSRRVEYGQ